MKEESAVVTTIDLLHELADLEDELEAAMTIPLVEVDETDIVEEALCVPDVEVEEAPPDTVRVPSLEIEMSLRQGDSFQKTLLIESAPFSERDLTSPPEE